MNVLHILAGGGVGGIETLIREYAQRTRHKNTYVFICGGGVIAEKMQAENKRVYIFNTKIKNILALFKKIEKICKQQQIEMLVEHHASPFSHLCLLYFSIRKPEIKKVSYAHSHIDVMRKIEKKRGLVARTLILKQSIKACDGVIAISKMVARSIVNSGYASPEKVHVVYNGVDLKRFRHKIHTQPANGRVKFVYVGRLISQKGVQNIIESIALTKNRELMSFSIVGDGNYRKDLEKLTQTLKLENVIEFLGVRDDIPDILCQSDVFLHFPNCEEGFGITIVEAMSCGLLCICGKKGAIPEIITNGVNGILLKETDPVQIAEIVDNILENGIEYYAAIREKAVERARDFSIDYFTRKLDETLNYIMEK